MESSIQPLKDQLVAAEIELQSLRTSSANYTTCENQLRVRVSALESEVESLLASLDSERSATEEALSRVDSVTSSYELQLKEKLEALAGQAVELKAAQERLHEYNVKLQTLMEERDAMQTKADELNSAVEFKNNHVSELERQLETLGINVNLYFLTWRTCEQSSLKPRSYLERNHKSCLICLTRQLKKIKTSLRLLLDLSKAKVALSAKSSRIEALQSDILNAENLISNLNGKIDELVSQIESSVQNLKIFATN
ncbi:hypothetical protein BCR33DRAFT_132087 [Rhizoclosmatium globosum]|uniref:Uncharacterized protein n=1 Tax=Rhizoclosmatium globosum TaxID=329046 RepID=A0A1Y2CHT9_9FUNG|nr:hypothetical protein BCR33DRAFT_132087 [Rhizoclosmatium globosum]|eukprot:ORY46610.1 hypothetical protein BCR33DRAFT_132087 [Rhizoclosmatium globosum]